MITRRQFLGTVAGAILGMALCSSPQPTSLVQQAQAANVVKSVHIVPSEDGTLYSRFPAGDSPTTGDVCDVPSGWACANVGNGSGSIDQITATNWAFDVIGSNNREENRFAYKDAGSADVQIIARVDRNDYTGNTSGFAGIAVGLRDSINQSAWLHQCRVPATGTFSVSSIYRLDASTFQGANGAPGQPQPRWIGMTYDFDNKISTCWESSDGTNWINVLSVTHDYSDVIAYISANSNSDTVAIQGHADNISLSSTITIYTPPNPPGGTPPQVVTLIPNQIKQQGSVFNLNCASFFHDPDNDPMTFTMTGPPVGSGISMNSACQFSGTLNATDRSNSPYNIKVTASDNVDGSVDDIFSMTVTTSSGTTYGPYGSGIAIIDCNSAETATIKGNGAGAGDTILLAGGNRGALTIRDCAGTDTTPLTIKNDPSASAPTVIRRQSASESTFVLTLDSISNVVLGPDGNGAKFSGGTADWCGVDEGDNSPSGDNKLRWLEDSDTTCGIVITRVAGVTVPTAYMKVGGLSTKYTIQGIEIDGLNRTDSGNSGIGISANDHNVKERDHPTFWREDLYFLHLYVHDQGFPSGGEGMYIGTNGYGRDPGDDGNDVPLRRVRISHVLMENISSDCINPKYWLQGPNFVDHNHLYDCGANSGAGNGRSGIASLDGGDVDIHSNLIINAGNNSIQCSIASAIVDSQIVNGFQQQERDTGPYYCFVYNNIIVAPLNRCINATRTETGTTAKPGTRAQFDPIRYFNNTCVSPTDNLAFSIASSINGSKAVRDNIIGSGSCGGNFDGMIAPASAANNNRCDTTTSHAFVTWSNDSNFFNDDFHLTSGSPARNTGTNQAPPVDFDGDVRPQQTIDDQGADEYVP